AVHFQLVLRRAGEAKMKKNRILWKLSSHRPSQITVEEPERLFLCVPLRKPLRPLRLERNLRNPPAWLINLSALLIPLFFSSPAFSQSRSTISVHVHDPPVLID